LALPIIPDGLRQLGFEVDTVTAYINSMPQNPQRTDLSKIDRIVFTSPSTIDNFIRLYGSLPEGKVFDTRGPVTEHYLHTKIKQHKL
jgi:uroporphyrinogen-III synthase